MSNRTPPNRSRRPMPTVDPYKLRPGMPPSPSAPAGGSLPGFANPAGMVSMPGMGQGRNGQMRPLPNVTGRPRSNAGSAFGGTFGGQTTPRPGMQQPGRSAEDWLDDDDPWGDLPSGLADLSNGRISAASPASSPSSTAGRRQPDRSFWEERMADIRGQSNTVDPTQDWGDDDWMDTYEPGDYVQVKADGNPNFGKSWDGDSWEDSDPNDPANASMFAESNAWDDDYQQGLREAWANNDETAFQRWRNLARANMTSQWQNQPAAAQPEQPTYNLPKRPGKPDKPKAPVTPTTPTYTAPEPWKRKQSPIY